jgi:hypothetical protein
MSHRINHGKRTSHRLSALQERTYPDPGIPELPISLLIIMGARQDLEVAFVIDEYHVIGATVSCPCRAKGGIECDLDVFGLSMLFQV